MFKFHDDPTVYESGITILLRDIWMYAEKKKEGFGRERTENEVERKV